ncbi:hypothetical protein FGO68_gene7989 [Halteria grandinella]|uniref:Uncharacterized protein n=1 Tax=Halteria grandinella TaxID=5974 RepID=A0A8J8P3F3_HALGN|nr:hypothetical protein FGO68_gene7989 [Halteria grandinella]
MKPFVAFALTFLLIQGACGQSCALSPNYIKGFAQVYEHLTTFDVSQASAIETDNKGSVYACGTGDFDTTGWYTRQYSQAFIFKTNYAGALQWKFLFSPLLDYYTFCNGLAWAADISDTSLTTAQPLVFVGHTYIQYGGGVEDQRCFVAQVNDDLGGGLVYSFVLDYMGVQEHTCVQAKYFYSASTVNTVYILGQLKGMSQIHNKPFIMLYNTQTNLITQLSIMENLGVTMTGIDMEFSFELNALFLLGNMRSYKFSYQNQDCFIIKTSIDQTSPFNLNGRLSGALLGTPSTSDTCTGLATNRYDWQVVTALSIATQPSNSASVAICHIIMMNEYHDIRWSREFGNGDPITPAYYQDDGCPDAVISDDGFLVIVIGHTYDFTSLATPVQTLDMYILVLKVGDGTILKQRFFTANKDDWFHSIKLVRDTLYILGDTTSVIPWAAGPDPVDYVRRAAIVFKMNIDLIEANCWGSDYWASKFPIFDNTGRWISDQSIVGFYWMPESALGSWVRRQMTDYYPGLGYSIDITFQLIQKLIYQCTFATYFDLADAPEYLVATTAKEAAYQVSQFCHDIKISMGINAVTFTNDTQVDLMIKLNAPNGFFFEKAKTQINGIPKYPGDYGIRFSYIDTLGLSHYGFMRVTSDGENKANRLYLPNTAVDRPFTYTLVDEELFSSITYPIMYYELASQPTWLTINDRVLSGTPTYVSTQTFPLTLTFSLSAFDETRGKTTIQVQIIITNQQPILVKDSNLTLCAFQSKQFYYQLPFESSFSDQDFQQLTTVLLIDNSASLPFNGGITFDQVSKAFIGTPTLLAPAKHLLNIRASDTFSVSNGIQRLQIEVLPQPSSLPVFVGNLTEKCIVITQANATITQWSDDEVKMLDFGMCLPKIEDRQRYSISGVEAGLKWPFDKVNGKLTIIKPTYKQFQTNMVLKIVLNDPEYQCFDRKISINLIIDIQPSYPSITELKYKGKPSSWFYQTIALSEILLGNQDLLIGQGYKVGFDRSLSKWVEIILTQNQTLKIFGFTEGQANLNIINLPLTILGKGQYSHSFIVLLSIDISEERPSLQVNNAYLTNQTLQYSIIQGYLTNLTIPYQIIYAQDPLNPPYSLDLRNATIEDIISLSISSNPPWVILDVSTLTLRAKAPFLSPEITSLTYYFNLHALDSISGTYEMVTIVLTIERSMASELKASKGLVEIDVMEGTSIVEEMNEMFENTDEDVVYVAYSPDKFTAEAKWWPEWVKLNQRHQQIHIETPALKEKGEAETYHIWLQAYNKALVQDVESGIFQPPTVQLTITITPNFAKLGRITSLHESATALYITGALISCLALSLIAFTQKPLEKPKNLIKSSEEAKLKEILKEEKKLKQGLYKFIIENGGTISGWKRGQIPDQQP